MSSPDLHQYHSSLNSIGPAKPRLAVGQHKVEIEVERQDRAAPGRVPERPPRRYWLRALVLIFIPTIIAAYYAIIWVQLLQKSRFDEVVKYRTFSGSLIYYSWFLIGVFGLSWFKFGLLGVEASMLCSHFWGAPNLVALLMHANRTWSGPSGWIKAVARREFHRLWCLFAFLSLLPLIAIPLSGLVFEISDGYIKISDAPAVVGRNKTTFNSRNELIGALAEQTPARASWLVGSAPVLPGLGILFNGESIDRTQHSVFERLPNSLPLTESIPDLFLTAQPDKPVAGTAWGLRLKYDCSIVRSASEFTILSQKSVSEITFAAGGTILLQTPSRDSITLRKSTSLTDSVIPNLHAYFETGTSAPRDGQDYSDEADKYNGRHPGFDAELVFEYAVWQIRSDGTYQDHRYPFNTTLEPTIGGMGGPFFATADGQFALNDTFLTLNGGEIGSKRANVTNTNIAMNLTEMINGSAGHGRMLYAAPPIGVRCVASSDLGTAELDGVTSTFGNFQRVNPEFNKSTLSKGSPRFGRSAAQMLDAQYYQHFVSGGLPVSRPGSEELNGRYTTFLNPETLLRSVNLAHALDAFDLLYDADSVSREEWLEPGLTSSREGKVLSVASLIPGSAVGYFVLALFCGWAAPSVGLALAYGFRKRPADRLDGYSMLRIGADMAPELIDNHDFMSGMPYDDSGTMAAMPCNVSGRGGSIRRAYVGGEELKGHGHSGSAESG